MKKAKPTKLAQRHWRYALLAYLIVAALVCTVIVKPSLVLMWSAGGLILLVMLATHYHTRQGRIHKDTLIEYMLVLLASLVVLLGAMRH